MGSLDAMSEDWQRLQSPNVRTYVHPLTQTIAAPVSVADADLANGIKRPADPPRLHLVFKYSDAVVFTVLVSSLTPGRRQGSVREGDLRTVATRTVRSRQ